MTVTWHSAKFLKRVDRASRLALDETAAAAALLAQADLYPGHGLITGILQGSIQAKEARRVGGRLEVRWGGFDIRGQIRGTFGPVDTNYALHVERRYGFLRKAMDAEAPKIARRIKDWL